MARSSWQEEQRQELHQRNLKKKLQKNTEQELKKKSQKANTMTEEEEKDESFEIISEKEKLWRDYLIEAETNYIKSEASMLQNEAMIKLAKEERDKEAKKNAR